MPGDETRERIFAATYDVVARCGIAKTTVDDVAREAGVSRATVYRHFPNGREQLVRETVDWEVARFLARMGAAVEGAPDFATLVARGLVWARQAVEHHDVLQRLLANEPERVVPELFTSTLMLSSLRAFLTPELERVALRPGVDVAWAADELARLVLSFIEAPGRWDLDDAEQVQDLVRRHFLAPVALDQEHT